MQVSVENTGSLGRKLTVQLPAQEIEGKVSNRIRDLGKQVRLKGFRPGKVPFQVLEKRFGKQVREEVVGEMIQQSFQTAVSQENLRPATTPQIDTPSPEADADFKYTASFEVLPELEELDLSTLEITRPVAEVTDADVDNMIETLRRQRQSWEDVERPVADGDLVLFHYSFETDGQRFPEEGEERAGAIVGNGAFDQAVEAELVGLSGDETKTAKVTLGDGFQNDALAGRTGQLSLRIEKIQASVLPEVDDQFIESFGISEGGLEKFRQDVRENLQRELKQTASRQLRNHVMSVVVDAYPDLEVPVSMIEAEQQAMVQQAQQQMQQMGQGDQPAPDPGQFAEAAERRVRAALLVTEIARHHDISIDGNRVREAINEIAATYEDPQAIANLYYGEERLMNNVQNLVLEEQVVDCVLDKAQVNEQSMSFDELMNPAP